MTPQWISPLAGRLDAFLAKEGGLPSRQRAQRAIEEKRVRVNGQIVQKPALRLRPGDTVELAEGGDERRDEAVTPADLKLSVLHEDGACLVIDKPAGLAVHPAPGLAFGEATVLHGVAHLFAERGLPFSSEATLVHRLDRETTGCLLVAKTVVAHGVLQKQFETRTVEKRYLALVAGVPKPPAATIDAPVGRSTSDRTKMAVISASKPRDARTTYRTLATTTDAALLLCELHTGRTHQLRVHLPSIGHPILGDPTYASTVSEKVSRKHGFRDLLLHAWTLAFDSPADGRVTTTAPLPAAFANALKKLDLPIPSAAQGS